MALAEQTTEGTDEEDSFPAVVSGKLFEFPRDHGAHPRFRTEWWYLTAWLDTERGPLGLQLTFFRVRTPYGIGNPSRFAPRQLLLAHAAISDPADNQLVHAEQAFRVDPRSQTAEFGNENMDLAIGLPLNRWSFSRRDKTTMISSVKAAAFEFDLQIEQSGPVVAQGDAGVFSKGPTDEQASYYYSLPQLSITGRVRLEDTDSFVTGTGWFDHEWASAPLDDGAPGWDWAGLNLVNGDALMVNRIRTREGGVLVSEAHLIPQSTITSKEKDIGTSEAKDVKFEPVRWWTSAATGAKYPVVMRVVTDEHDLTLEPMFDDAELDTRSSTGIIY